jgi:hypothetical protein
MKIRPLGAALFHADRRKADITKLVLTFRISANAPTNKELIIIVIRIVTQGRALKKVS